MQKIKFNVNGNGQFASKPLLLNLPNDKGYGCNFMGKKARIWHSYFSSITCFNLDLKMESEYKLLVNKKRATHF